MEKVKCNLKEALTCLFQEGWQTKVLCLALLFIPSIIFNIAWSYTNLRNTLTSNYGLIFAIVLVVTFCSYLCAGYFDLYSHDRAYDKNAKLRNWPECIADAFFAGAKHCTGLLTTGIIFYIVFGLALLIACIIIGILAYFAPLFAIIFGIIAAIAGLIGTIYFILFAYRLSSNFRKDLKLSSWFKWGEAIDLTRSVPVGARVILMGILLYLVLSVLVFIESLFITPEPQILSQKIVYLVLLFIVSCPLGIYIQSYISNLFGQYIYNAIKQNLNKEPETLPKEINKDRPGIVIAVITYLLICLSAAAYMMYLPTLIEKQKESEARTKMLKAISNYEHLVTIYMVKAQKNNASGMFDKDCQNAGKYFKHATFNGCNVTEADGVYWQINEKDGSVAVFSSKENPKYSIKMGVCKNGEVNCEEDYPQVKALINALKPVPSFKKLTR